ncbi:hypothetical protein M758_UG154500 [Ceratodon purpureus]|nr:hypothetical protein M758_UG154500 [Ceratodon purpureus]
MKLVDRHAAGFTSLNASLTRPSHSTVVEGSMGKQKGKGDPKGTKNVKGVEEPRSRSAPQSVVPRSDSGPAHSTRSAQEVASPDADVTPLPAPPAATLPAPRVVLFGRTARPKQTVAKKARGKQASAPPAPIPPSAPLYSHPGLDDLDTEPGEASAATATESTIWDISREIMDATENPASADLATITGPPSGHVDDNLNILPRPSAPKPTKVTLTSETLWSSNPKVDDLDPNLVIPEELETEIVGLEKPKKGEDKDTELRKRSLLNDKFARESEYMYIFEREQLFELALMHMEPSDHKSGRIYRDYEKCARAQKFKIINGQHTWHAALSCLNDPILRQTNLQIEQMKIWDVQVVWTEKISPLHALSFKCNKGHSESWHLTSLVRAILHCRVL